MSQKRESNNDNGRFMNTELPEPKIGYLVAEEVREWIGNWWGGEGRICGIERVGSCLKSGGCGAFFVDGCRGWLMRAVVDVTVQM